MELSPDPHRESIWADDQSARPRLSGFSLLIFSLSVIIAFAALSASLTLFLGFAENDTSIPAMMPAFILCFGIGGIAYVPAFIMAGLSYPRRRKAPGKTTLWVSVAMIVPWLLFSVGFVINSPLEPIFGLGAGLISVIFLLWLLRQIFKRVPRKDKASSR